jgi:L-lactate utilization protein LutB
LDEYLNCIHCGLCLFVCPAYREMLTRGMGSGLAAASIDIQKKIKAALDPLKILNPGKILPD